MWKLTLSYHILQCDETLPNSIERKHPKKGRENETRGKDRSQGKQTAQQRQGHWEEMEPLRTKPLQCRFENWYGIGHFWKFSIQVWVLVFIFDGYEVGIPYPKVSFIIK
jgi:hypothetical protein